MTTYPLSEPATIYPVEGEAGAQLVVLGNGTLAECADIIAGLTPDEKTAVKIQMDDLDLKFEPGEVGELLRFLREESPGLSNSEIVEIKDPEA